MKVKLLLQIGLVFGVCLIGEAAAHYLPLPIPASVLSMVLLFLLLLTCLKVEHIREKTDFLLKNMAFFFIPAGVGILAQAPVLRENLLPLVAILLVSTLLTFLVTAYTVRGVVRLQEKYRTSREARR